MSSLGIRCWKKWCKAQGALEMVYLLMSPNFNLSILVESSLFISSCTAKEHGCTNTIKASIACWSARCPFCLCSVYPFAEPKRGRRRRKAQWNDCKYQYSPVSQMKCLMPSVCSLTNGRTYQRTFFEDKRWFVAPKLSVDTIVHGWLAMWWPIRCLSKIKKIEYGVIELDSHWRCWQANILE